MWACSVHCGHHCKRRPRKCRSILMIIWWLKQCQDDEIHDNPSQKYILSRNHHHHGRPSQGDVHRHFVAKKQERIFLRASDDDVHVYVTSWLLSHQWIDCTGIIVPRPIGNIRRDQIKPKKDIHELIGVIYRRCCCHDGCRKQHYVLLHWKEMMSMLWCCLKSTLRGALELWKNTTLRRDDDTTWMNALSNLDHYISCTHEKISFHAG